MLFSKVNALDANNTLSNRKIEQVQTQIKTNLEVIEKLK